MTYRAGLVNRWAVVVPIALVMLAAPMATKAQSLNLAETVWPPFTDLASRPQYASELVGTALSGAGYESETRIVDIETLLGGLRAGIFDGSAALWRVPEREAYLLYSEPYLENRLVLVGRAGSDVSATALSELAGKRLALVQGYAYGAAVTASEGIELVYGIDLQENLRKLLNDEADFLLVDELVIRTIARNQPEEVEQHLAIGTQGLVTRTLHFAVRRDRPDAQAIVDAFNDQIVAMMVDGTYNRILQLEWIRADVDGDGQAELILGFGQAASALPADTYALFSRTADPLPSPDDAHFVIDGQVYEDWNAVPDEFRTRQVGPVEPSNSRMPTPLFTF